MYYFIELQSRQWPWYGSCININLLNHFLSPLKLRLWFPHMVMCTRYNIVW